LNIHPWHDVEIETDSRDSIQAVIEIPKNSRAKYELDKESGMLMLDRVLFSSINYPANYGFIPQTYCDDNDPLDILVLSQIEIVPMCIVEAKVIGVMQMLDGDEKDDKIIAVAKNDMSVSHIDDISDLSKHHMLELRSFFEDYKKLENKTVIVEEFLGKEGALKIVSQSILDYKKKFPK
jgi:inorganic pyrophosphatase